MRHSGWLVAVLLVAGCGSSGTDYEYPTEPVTSTDVEFEVDPAIYENPKTSELGTDRTRGIAKTIEWPQIGTEMGTAYCGGGVVVDQVLRHDADNFYGVTVRLKNTANGRQGFQWRVVFYSAKGESLIGFNHDEKEAPVWKSIVIDPLAYEVVTDSCRLKGAVGFRLFLRKSGGNDEGLPDGFRSGKQR